MAEVPAGYRRIEGSERRPVRGARRVSPADPNEKLSLTIRVRRRPGAPPLPDQNYWAANPPGRRQFLSREELVAQIGAAQADLDKVAEFARSQGFEVVQTSVARRTVRVSGTVAQANRAFAVDLGRYESPQESYRGREGHLYLPGEVADVIEGVFGLDNRRMAHRAGGVPPAGTVPLTPPQVAKLYNFPPLEAAGQTIGILEFGGGFSQTDLDLFCTTNGAPKVVPTFVDENGNIIPPPPQAGTLSSPDGNDQEVGADVQVAASVAHHANIVMFFASNSDDGWVNAVTNAIYYSPSPLTVLSISWGKPEDQWDSNHMWQLSLAFQEAALLGITVFTGAGDYGSCTEDNDGTAHVEYPASDPWVTSCGGTFIDTAPSPFVEGTWNDPLGATGGGVSVPPAPTQSGGGTGFPVPPWQGGLKYTAIPYPPSPPPPAALLTGRGVPDVAGNASTFSGYNFFFYGVNPLAYGGASTVAPLYAALIAILAAKAGWPLGYLNPLLYEIGNTAGQKALVPINDGANNAAGTSVVLPDGSNANPCTYYVSTPTSPTLGWNACTGWGRIDGDELLKALIPLEETRPTYADVPFSFGAGGEWLYKNDGGGSSSSGDSINAGQVNTANIYDCTIVQNNGPNNAVLAALNLSTGNGAVGLFGRSLGSTWSIGVAGESQTGCAMYGIATGDQPSSPNVIGVAGRSMGGIATETLPLEKVVGEPIGVLGHSANGPGVRGHGGPLLKQPEAGQFLPPAQAAPGGAFSSGRLHDKVMPGATVPQTVGLDSLAQLRLVPSMATHLPATAQIGDFFLAYVPNQDNRNPIAQLYVCTHFLGNVPQWQRVQMGTSIPGGSKVFS